MRKLWLKVKQSTAWRVLCRAYARWVEADGNEGAAAFAYYLLLSFLPLVILLVTAGSLFVERDVATQAVVQWVKHYVPLTGEQEHSAVATIGGMLAARTEGMHGGSKSWSAAAAQCACKCRAVLPRRRR